MAVTDTRYVHHAAVTNQSSLLQVHSANIAFDQNSPFLIRYVTNGFPCGRRANTHLNADSQLRVVVVVESQSLRDRDLAGAKFLQRLCATEGSVFRVRFLAGAI